MAIEAAFAVPHPPLIIPDVGKGEERGIQSTIDAYESVAQQVAKIEPELIILSSPHAPAYRDWFHISSGDGAFGDMSMFRAPQSTVSVTYDTEFVQYITHLAKQDGLRAGSDDMECDVLDHASFIPLWFIKKYYNNFKVVRIGLSGFDSLTHYQFGKLIKLSVENLKRRVVYIASGDLSHKLKSDGPYGFAPEGPQFDEQISQIFQTGDFKSLLSFDEAFTDAAAECGLRSFQIMAGSLDGVAIKSDLLSYEGPFGVGYAVASFLPCNPDDSRKIDDVIFDEHAHDKVDSLEQEDAYIKLARANIIHYILTGESLVLQDKQITIPARSKAHSTFTSSKESNVTDTAKAQQSVLTRLLQQINPLPLELIDTQAAVFVSIHKLGHLRGCIGTLEPTCESVANEILRNAILACSEDPRFDEITVDEIPLLSISVDVLGTPEAIQGIAELDPKRYGVIVSRGFRRGVLLPNLDGVDTAEQQVYIAKQKAGIDTDEPCALQRFEVVRHELGSV